MEEMEKEVLADRPSEVATEGVLEDRPFEVMTKGEVVPGVVEIIPKDPFLSSPSWELVTLFFFFWLKHFYFWACCFEHVCLFFFFEQSPEARLFWAYDLLQIVSMPCMNDDIYLHMIFLRHVWMMSSLCVNNFSKSYEELVYLYLLF